MPSPAFLLSRYLSPQTKWGPNEVPGGIPEFTSEDLRCATAYIGDSVSWMAVNAKWLGDERSHDGLLKLTEAQSWRQWETSNLKKVSEIRQGMTLNWLMSELAYADWLNPNGSRSETGCAGFLSQYPDTQVSPAAYVKHYKAHVDELANWLGDKEQHGLAAVKRYILEVA